MTRELVWRTVFLISLGILLLFVSEIGIANSVISHVVRDIGLAFLVSSIVWTVFEINLSHQSEKVWADRIEKVSQNVFQAVLRKNLPKELVGESNKVILDVKFIRRDYRLEYVISDFTSSDRKNAVVVNAFLNYKLKNISDTPEDVRLGLFMDNPTYDDLKKECDIISFSAILDDRDIDLNFAEKRELFLKRMAASNNSEIEFRLKELTIASNAEITVRAEYKMGMESDNTEMIEMMHPTDGIQFTIVNNSTASKIDTFARMVHRNCLEAVSRKSTPNTKMLYMSEFVLPHQGILVWWKRVE